MTLFLIKYYILCVVTKDKLCYYLTNKGSTKILQEMGLTLYSVGVPSLTEYGVKDAVGYECTA